jgi:hypothetical protein
MTSISDINSLLQTYSKKLTPICEKEDYIVNKLKNAESDEFLNVKVANLYMRLIKLKKDVEIVEQLGTLGLKMR